MWLCPSDQCVTHQSWWRPGEVRKKQSVQTQGHLNSSPSSSTTRGVSLVKTQFLPVLEYMAKYADKVGLLRELNDRSYVKYWAHYRWSIHVSYWPLLFLWIIYIFSIYVAFFLMLKLSPLVCHSEPTHFVSCLYYMPFTLTCDFCVSAILFSSFRASFLSLLAFPLCVSTLFLRQ